MGFTIRRSENVITDCCALKFPENNDLWSELLNRQCNRRPERGRVRQFICISEMDFYTRNWVFQMTLRSLEFAVLFKRRKVMTTSLRPPELSARSVPGPNFVLIGDGPKPYIQHLNELGRVLGLEGKLHFIGWRRDIPAIFRELDIFVIASRQEAFGRTVIEAWLLENPL